MKFTLISIFFFLVIMFFLTLLVRGQSVVTSTPLAVSRIWPQPDMAQIEVRFSSAYATNPTITMLAKNATKCMTIEIATGKVTYTNCSGPEMAALYLAAKKSQELPKVGK